MTAPSAPPYLFIGVTDFSVGQATLEDVFLQLAIQADDEEEEDDIDPETEYEQLKAEYEQNGAPPAKVSGWKVCVGLDLPHFS